MRQDQQKFISKDTVYKRYKIKITHDGMLGNH